MLPNTASTQKEKKVEEPDPYLKQGLVPLPQMGLLHPAQGA